MAQDQMSDEALTKLLNMFGMGAGAAGIGGGLYNIFGPGPGIAKEANKYLNQIPGAMQPYYQPYIGAGQNALGQLMGQYGQLTGSTGDVYNKLASGYQQSPGFQSALKQALGAAGNQAAAGGMTGTPQAQLQAADVAGTLSQRDFGDYMDRMQNLYSTGLQGMSGINLMGFGASSDYANMLGSLLGQQGQYAALEKAMRNQQRGQGIGQVAGGIGTMAAGPLSQYFNQQMNAGGKKSQGMDWGTMAGLLGGLGGFMLGGPAGATAGYTMGKGAGSMFGG